MKKLFVLFLCALLLPILPAMAEGPAEVPLFRLVTMDEAGREINMGSGVLMLDQHTLLTSAPVRELGVYAAYAPDGTAYEVTGASLFGSGFTMLELGEDAPLPAADFSDRDRGTCWLVGVTSNGLRYSAPAMNMTTTRYGSLDAWLVSASEALLPGAVLVQPDGALLGVAAATWGEGEARYVVLSSDALASALVAPLADVDVRVTSDSPWMQGVALSYEAGVLTIDWSGCAISELSDDSTFTVYVADNENTYYSYYVLDGGTFSTQLPVAPGREYTIGVCHTHSDTEDFSQLARNNLELFAVPEAGMFTDYGFTSECYLSACPIDEEPDPVGTLDPLENITVRALSDISQSLYFMVINTYDVEEDTEATMIFSLHTPEGYVFYSGSGYIFSPEYEAHDAWNADITDLFADYLSYGSNDFVPGDYELRYAIDGLWGDVFSFTLE